MGGNRKSSKIISGYKTVEKPDGIRKMIKVSQPYLTTNDFSYLYPKAQAAKPQTL
jgi:hypothetical protein